jgi:hypothetical protein
MNNQINEAIEQIEVSYEYMLAYAAQGRPTDKGESQSPVREYLDKMFIACETLLLSLEKDNKLNTEYFVKTIISDIHTSRSMLSMVLEMNDISSQIVDNLNASVHLRAMLTDLFILEDILKAQG